MKTSITNLRTSFFIITLTLSTSTYAKVVAKVTEVKGNVFAVLPNGKTVKATPNMHLDDKSEILVEENSTATFYDFYDTTYHLNGGSHLKILDKSVQLKGGKVWIKSNHAASPLSLISANTHVDFWKSEFITSFDQYTGKSQVMVVTGDLDVSNILDKNVKFSLTAGSFTLVDPEVNNGQPRQPTTVGPESLKTALAEFKYIPKTILDKQKEDIEAKRDIASVIEEKPAPVAAIVPEKVQMAEAPKKGEVTFIQTNRMPASVGKKDDALKYFKNKTVVSKPSTKLEQLTPAPIRIYGEATPMAAKVVTPTFVPSLAERIPASAPTSQPAKMIEDKTFTKSLNTHSDEQPQHKPEVQKLIDDLKSF